MTKTKKIIMYVISVFLLSVTVNCNFSEKKEQKDDYNLKAELRPGTPEVLDSLINLIKKQRNWNDFTYSSLETGIDTLNIYFGTMQVNSSWKGLWIAGHTNDSSITWSTAGKISDTSKFHTDTFAIELNNATKKVSLRVKHNPKTDYITYTWLNEENKSQTAYMEDIELPFRVNKPLPELELELMNGDTLSTKELSGKHVVINWWNTGCKPCIAAMPKLNNLVEKYKSASDVYFLAIAFDKRKRVENLLSKREFNFTHALGDMETAKIFGKSFPKYVILNSEGIVTYFTSGGSEQTYKKIDKLLAEQIE